eukprot:760685-Rhodomonas_salina.4
MGGNPKHNSENSGGLRNLTHEFEDGPRRSELLVLGVQLPLVAQLAPLVPRQRRLRPNPRSQPRSTRVSFPRMPLLLRALESMLFPHRAWSGVGISTLSHCHTVALSAVALAHRHTVRVWLTCS